MHRALRDRPRFTEVYEAADFTPNGPALYVSGRSHEERSRHVADLAARAPDTHFVDVVDQGDGTILLQNAAGSTSASLRSTNDLAGVWRQVPLQPYLDITGLPHHVWAALLRAAFVAGVEIKLVYVEPMRYRFNRIRTEGELFDLSLKFEGIGPLPGFLSLAEPQEEDVVLVPLLGFEGPRFSMILNHAQVARERVFPIIGVPGFQPEFVYYAYQGNRLPLEETRSWMSLQYAAANCPFSAYYALERIAAASGASFMRIAPIGTKPHSIAAILFALARPDSVEIIYDHPVRREGRTSGAARLLVYHVHALSSELVLP